MTGSRHRFRSKDNSLGPPYPCRTGCPPQNRVALLSGNALYSELAFDEGRYREHLAWQSELRVAGLFAAGGTGEGFSLTPAESAPGDPRRRRRDQRQGPGPGLRRRPHRPGHRTGKGMRRPPAPTASCCCRPYLTEADQHGPDRPCQRRLPGHQPWRHRLQPRQRHPQGHLRGHPGRPNPNLIGFKDGVGDIEQMTAYLRQARRPADLPRRPAHRRNLRPAAAATGREHLLLSACSTSSRSSRWTSTRTSATRTATAVYQKLNDFVIPYLDIRDRVKGYCCLHRQGRARRAIGRDGGPVRPPLQNLTEADLHELTTLINKIS